MDRLSCLLCGENALENCMPEGWEPVGVSSDVKLFPEAPPVHVCRKCGHVQQLRTAKWDQDVSGIYDNYSVYVLAGADDHQVFTPEGQGVSRAQTVAWRIAEQLRLPESGRLLDFGCGSGNFLQAFNRVRPGWELHGYDINHHYASRIKSLPAVAGFHSSIAGMLTSFDLITLNDVVEHLQDPVSELRTLQSLLTPEGRIFSRCPDYTANPFDLIVVDHASHFAPHSTAELLGLSELNPVVEANHWFPRVTAFCARSGATRAWPGTDRSDMDLPRRCLRWLKELPEFFLKKADSRELGVFGAAIAGLWVAAMLKPAVTFFLDEDPARCGGELNGLPIFSGAQIPRNAAVLLAFPPPMARAIQERFAPTHSGIEFILPPEME